MANGHGGAGRGQGRKSVSEELNSRMISQAGIINTFGSLQKGIEYCLNSGEPSLIKFVFEHALGKPVDRVAQTDKDGNDKKQVFNINGKEIEL